MSDFDVVVFGATGFTGRLVAEYLARHAGGAVWAIAGRSAAKLEAVRGELGCDVPILVGDSHDAESLAKIVRRTKVVCTTVGPYAEHGLPLVEQCAEAGTSYCDLTGEPHFIHEAIRRCHTRAQASGARIVHCCGFDSIPSDLGTLLLVKHFEAKGERIGRVRLRLRTAKGGFSGGTIASMFGILEAAKDPATRRILGDPYALIPEGAPRGRDRNERFRPARDADRGRWTAPFLMAPINTRVVRRSAALLGYGDAFSYEERMDAGRGAKGWMFAAGLSVGIGAFVATATLPGVSTLYEGLLPGSGEGPAKEKRDRGMFRIELFGENAGGTAEAIATVAGTSDPGYGETAKMLGESALSLAKDELGSPAGVLTPAAAMGMSLVERLRGAGMTFEVRG